MVIQLQVSMPHAALWVVQLDTVWAEAYERGRFNAARGFVGGAAWRRSTRTFPDGSFNAARGFVGGATQLGTVTLSGTIGFQCRTRLCGWCNSPHMRFRIGAL